MSAKNCCDLNWDLINQISKCFELFPEDCIFSDDIVNLELATKLWNFTTRLTVGKDDGCNLLAIGKYLD